jgi:hypothetical protein
MIVAIAAAMYRVFRYTRSQATGLGPLPAGLSAFGSRPGLASLLALDLAVVTGSARCRIAMLIPMLVEQARTYFDARAAVNKQANSMPGPLDEHFLDARPLLAAILVLANRRGLTDEQIRDTLRIGTLDDQLRALAQLRDLARRGAQGEGTEQQAAAEWLLGWLDERPADATHYTLILMGAHSFLNAALQRPLGGS